MIEILGYLLSPEAYLHQRRGRIGFNDSGHEKKRKNDQHIKTD